MSRKGAKNGRIRGMNIPPADEARERVADLLEATRYAPKEDPPKDRHGMPLVAREPNDPDDE